MSTMSKPSIRLGQRHSHAYGSPMEFVVCREHASSASDLALGPVISAVLVGPCEVCIRAAGLPTEDDDDPELVLGPDLQHGNEAVLLAWCGQSRVPEAGWPNDDREAFREALVRWHIEQGNLVDDREDPMPKDDDNYHKSAAAYLESLSIQEAAYL